MSLAVENVQDYPRPPLCEPVSHRLRIVHLGVLVAETTRGVRVCETHHPPTYYFPQADVLASLRMAEGGSFCEWKGAASYWDVVSGDQVIASAAWSYARPSDHFAAIADHVAFYANLFGSCFVGEERVIPQPSDFYGGWVTANLTGDIKGPPGTRHW